MKKSKTIQHKMTKLTSKIKKKIGGESGGAPAKVLSFNSVRATQQTCQHAREQIILTHKQMKSTHLYLNQTEQKIQERLKGVSLAETHWPCVMEGWVNGCC